MRAKTFVFGALVGGAFVFLLLRGGALLSALDASVTGSFVTSSSAPYLSPSVAAMQETEELLAYSGATLTFPLQSSLVCVGTARDGGNGQRRALTADEQPNHLVIDPQTETIAQCIASVCRQFPFHVVETRQKGAAFIHLASDQSSGPTWELFTDGRYRDEESGGYLGSCQPTE